jgi:hypothetical protein
MTSETRELAGVLISVLPWLVFVALVALFALVAARDRRAERNARRRRDSRKESRAAIVPRLGARPQRRAVQ